jgi:hypothetical protein
VCGIDPRLPLQVLLHCLLLDPAGARFAIRPAGEFRASRRYVDQTMVLQTTFTTAVLTDALALGRNDRGHHLGAGSPGVLLRRLVCTIGEIDAEVSYAPRPEYGLIRPFLVPVPGGWPPGVALTGCSCPRRSAMTLPATQRPPGSAWPPGRPPSSRSATARWPARRWPRGPQQRSPPASVTPQRDGGPGRPSTRTTNGRGGSWWGLHQEHGEDVLHQHRDGGPDWRHGGLSAAQIRASAGV